MAWKTRIGILAANMRPGAEPIETDHARLYGILGAPEGVSSRHGRLAVLLGSQADRASNRHARLYGVLGSSADRASTRQAKLNVVLGAAADRTSTRSARLYAIVVP